jgi:hypothetical protein
VGLIGKEMFAIDGCKLPSNATKAWSGTKKGVPAQEREDGESHQTDRHPARNVGKTEADPAAILLFFALRRGCTALEKDIQ